MCAQAKTLFNINRSIADDVKHQASGYAPKRQVAASFRLRPPPWAGICEIGRRCSRRLDYSGLFHRPLRPLTKADQYLIYYMEGCCLHKQKKLTLPLLGLFTSNFARDCPGTVQIPVDESRPAWSSDPPESTVLVLVLVCGSVSKRREVC